MSKEKDNKKELKEELGKIIKSYRLEKGRSQRGLAKAIDMPNSNLKYIEDGINAPSFEIYKKIMDELNPNANDRERMDYLYSKIRGTPPPDICDFMLANHKLFAAIRKNKGRLTKAQTEKLNALLETFAKENMDSMEEKHNGKKGNNDRSLGL